MPEKDKIPQIKPEEKTETGQIDLNPPQIKPDTTEANTRRLNLKSVKNLRLRKPSLARIRNLSKRAKIILGVVAAILIIFVIFPFARLGVNATTLKANLDRIQAAVDTQDLGKIKTETVSFKNNLVVFQGNLTALQYMRFVPLLGNYYLDAESAVKAGVHSLRGGEIIVNTLEPYADIFGLKQGESSGTANDRVEFIVQTIGQIAPQLDEIAVHAQAAQAEIHKINPRRYPKVIFGKKARENIQQVQTIVDQAVSFISDGKPLMQKANYFLGVESPRTYLILFQNDKEIRPTGGFLTAYTIMTIDKGKFQPAASSDIYSLDAKYTPAVEASEELKRYIQGPYVLQPNYFLRDMNWSPDFKVSMDLFSEEAKKAELPEVDGIIAVDTEVLVKILKVLGQVDVPEFGKYTAENDERCDCPQVVYALEEYADVEGPVVWSENEPGKIVFAPPNYGKNRKEIVGPLMNSVLSNTLGQPVQRMPFLFQAAWESLTEKHVLLYMFDEEAQAAVESFNVAGRIIETESDYLHVNNANLGGRKSNLYATHEVNQQVQVGNDGTVEKTVTITYKNPQGYDGWLNSVLPTWVRVYVPQGSELISFEGTEEQKEPYEDLGKTVFAGGFKLRPQGVIKVVVKYKLPFKVQNDEYKVFIQKQPGTGPTLHTFEVGNELEEVLLKTDQEFKFSL